MFRTKHSKVNWLQKTIEPKKWTDNKIIQFKYENTKLLGNAKYNQVMLVLAVFGSAYRTKLAPIILSKLDTVCNSWYI